MTTSELPTIHDRYSEEEIADFYERGYWREESPWDEVVAAADEHGDRVFLTDHTRELTFTELRDRVEAFAVALHELGLRKGDRILLHLPNWVEFTVALLGAARAGVITVPTMTIYRHDDVKYVLEHSGAKLVVTTQEFGGFDYLAMHRRLRDAVDSVQGIVVVRADAGEGEHAFDQLVERDVTSEQVRALSPAGPDDGHIILYTTGTTARPKGCLHTWNTVQFTARAMGRELKWSADDVAFGPSPVAHGTGYMTSIAGPLLAGAASHLMDKWEPDEGLRRIEEYGCTCTVTATAFLQMLIKVYDPSVHDPSSMRVWVAAGAPIPPTVIEQGRKVLGGCAILSLYGRSENFLTTMCSIDDPPERSLTSDGSAVEGIEVAIVDDEGHEVPRAEHGDIAYRGPGHMIGYFRDEERTGEMFTPDGFSRSGDLGYMGEDGYVRVSGRLKDIIIRGGLNISASEVEDHLLSHPAVEAAAVVAMPDERLGEKACAFVVTAPGESFDFQEMVRFLRDERDIAVQKRPERLEIVAELPMTATGKIRKHVLRDEIAEKVGQEADTGLHGSRPSGFRPLRPHGLRHGQH